MFDRLPTFYAGKENLILKFISKFIKEMLKSEARNPKSETKLNDRNSNGPNIGISARIFIVFVIRAFDILICFEIRYSDFEFCPCHLRKT